MLASSASNLTVVHDGATLLAACAEVTVYWRGPMHSRAKELVALYRHALAELGPTLRFYETGTMVGARPVKGDTLEMLPFWLERAKPRRDIYMLSLESGAKRNEPSDRSFFFIADEDDDEPIGALRVCLPLEVLEKDPIAFSSKVAEWIGALDFESGHAGFGINWDPRGDSALQAQDAISRIAARYHGVDLFDLDVSLVAMRQTRPAGVKRISWIALIGSILVERLGGIERIATRLAGSAKVVPLPRGALIQAGPVARLGDANRNEDMSNYRAVGRMLAPHRFIDHKPLFGSTQGDAQADTERWLARFDH